jgi:serine O-acetyltransferase
MKNLEQDYEFLFHRKPSKRNIVSAFLFTPGFRSVAMLRIQQALESRNKYLLALGVSNLNHFITGAELCVGVRIGVPFIIRHPAGIVIGGGVEIGSNCILLHGVTIGEKYIREPDGIYPIIGDNVSIGCNSSIIGKVEVGDFATIGAHTLVLNDVSPGETVVGNH